MTGRRLVWLLCPLLVAALVYELGRARRLYSGNLTAAIVKDVTIAASQQGRLSPQLMMHNLELLRAHEPLAPTQVALPISRGGLYLLLDRPQAAIRAYEQALKLEHRGEIFAHLGRAYLKLGNRQAAEDAFHTAIVLDHTQRKRIRGFVPKERLRRLGLGAEDDEDDAGVDDVTPPSESEE